MAEKYEGMCCSGTGDADILKLIDDSLSMLNPTPHLPNITMLYNPDGDTLKEGFIWGDGFWLQNSYGFVYGSTPFLSAPWARIVQNSLDLHWERIGDGERMGVDTQVPDNDHPYLNLCAPDGALGDFASKAGIAYKQGDGDFNDYDWFYEAAAAALNMQADILLAHRRMDLIAKYLPLMRRSSDFMERTRDKKNNLFLVGPGCNLLAPSYGAAKNGETGKIEKCYLSGLSITYCAALAKMIELFALAGDLENEELYTRRYDITRASLSLLMTQESFFVKYMEQDGTLHGCYGQKRHGYFEAVCNIDAVAFHVVDEAVSRSIYEKIVSIPELRPFDFLANNYPGLDDAPWDLQGIRGDWKPGDWVDGGCWGTVEGRAILAYLSLGHYPDALNSVRRHLKWAEDYRMDAPFSQWGENRYNPWANEFSDDAAGENSRQTGVMIDNFAISACLIRGILGCSYDRKGIILDIRLPQEITSYSQRIPIQFGGLELLITVINGEEAPSVTINGEHAFGVSSYDHAIRLEYDRLKEYGGRELKIVVNSSGQAVEAKDCAVKNANNDYLAELLPDELGKAYLSCINEYCSLGNGKQASDYGIFLNDVIKAFRAAAQRRILPFDKQNFRPMTCHKREEIIALYDISAMNLYRGLKYRE